MSIIQDDQNKIEIKELEFYFKSNRNSETSLQILWEAHKAVIRGFLCEDRVYIKKVKRKEN